MTDKQKVERYLPSEKFIDEYIALAKEAIKSKLGISVQGNAASEREAVASLVDGTLEFVVHRKLAINHDSRDIPFQVCSLEGKFNQEIYNLVSAGIFVEIENEVLPLLGKDIVDQVSQKSIERGEIYTLYADASGIYCKINPALQPIRVKPATKATKFIHNLQL